MPVAANAAERLATYTAEFDLDHVPQEVIAAAKRCLLDAIGIGLASTGTDYGRSLANALSEIGGFGRFPVLGSDLTLSQRDAAHLNGTLIHGLDYDDTHSEAIVHSSASAVPTMLSAGLAAGATGSQAIAAFIIASEIACRIGAAVSGGVHRRGFHPTAICGAFGSAMASGYLNRLSPAQLVSAQGIVLSKASGSLQFLDDGAWTKRNHPGWASVCGQTAAAMAKHGYFGPQEPYGGRFGLFALFAAQDVPHDYERLAGGLGERWEIPGIAFKPYPACHMTHAYADAMLALAEAHRLTPAQVKRITLYIHPGEIPVIAEPVASKRRPQNAYDAQFSAAYVAATALSKGRFTLADLEPDALADPEVLGLCALTDHEADPELPYPKYFPGRVTVETVDGRELDHLERINLGAAEKPLSDADIDSKFRDNAARALSAEQAEQLREVILTLEDQPDLSSLAKAIRPA